MFDFAKATERELLEMVGQDNQLAFRQIFDRYHQQVATFVFRINKSKVESEEIVQEVFLKVWKKRGELCQINNFKAYLYTISKNYALNSLKSVAHAYQSKHQPIEFLLTEQSTESCAIDGARIELLEEAIDALSEQQKRVFLMSKRERLKYNEIAIKLNISKETVKKYIQIATTHVIRYVKEKSLTLIIFLPNLP